MRRRRTSTLGLGIAAALTAGLLFPAAAEAAPGDANARGVQLALDAAVSGVAVIDATASIGAADAPPGGGTDTDTVATFTLPGGAVGVSATGTGVEVAATRGPASSSASSSVADVAVNVFGVPTLSTTDVTARVACPATGDLSAEADVAAATLFGDAVTVGAAAVTATSAVTVPGLADAELEVTLEQVETVTGTDATAIAVQASLTLTGTAAGVPITPISVGTIRLASATCTRPTAGPVATGISPASGPTTGGQRVTITGSGFVPGGTQMTFDGVPAIDVEVAPGGTSLTALTPRGAAGPASVVVGTSAGDSAPLAYTYVAAADPRVTSITPTHGPTTGGTRVTITGSGFTGVTGVTFDGVPGSGVSVNPAGTVITVTTPPNAAGPAAVVLQSPGTSTPAGTFTYVASPTAASITPSSGPTSGGQTVVITGSGFVLGATVVTFDGVRATDVRVLDSDTLLAVTPAGAAGPAEVVVSVRGIPASPLGYRYVAGAGVPPAPSIQGIDPDPGPTTGGTQVTVSGSGFVPGATTVVICGKTIAAAQVTVPADGTAAGFVTPACAAGDVDVLVVTPGGVAGATFTYVEGAGTGDQAGGGMLPETGADVTLLSWLGAALVAIGTLLARRVRRRRPSLG